ncbi:MAG: type II toxin-antitoxin system Phd/YefM family antitoxin [Ardenticatenaceae bacterium]
MNQTITATELAKSLSDILNRIRYQGERFIIERNGEPVATLSPTGAPTSVTLQTLAEQVGDLSLPDPYFADDLETLQAAQPPAETSGWDS